MLLIGILSRWLALLSICAYIVAALPTSGENSTLVGKDTQPDSFDDLVTDEIGTAGVFIGAVSVASVEAWTDNHALRPDQSTYGRIRLVLFRPETNNYVEFHRIHQLWGEPIYYPAPRRPVGLLYRWQDRVIDLQEALAILLRDRYLQVWNSITVFKPVAPPGQYTVPDQIYYRFELSGNQPVVVFLGTIDRKIYRLDGEIGAALNASASFSSNQTSLAQAANMSSGDGNFGTVAFATS